MDIDSPLIIYLVEKLRNAREISSRRPPAHSPNA